MEERESSERIDLAALASRLRRRMGLIVACAVLLPLIAVGLSLAQEKQYSATASLLFRDPAFDQKLFGSTFLAPNRDPDREAATNTELVELDSVASRTAARLGRGLSGSEVSNHIKVTQEGRSDVVTIVATDASPAFAARLANLLAEEYIRFRQAADRAKIEAAQGLVERQIADLGAQAGGRAQDLQQRAQQLRVLASLQTGNAEIVGRATRPTSPSSPRTVRNGVLGLILGLGLGIALALLRERLDRRIRDPKEVGALFDRPVLGAIPETRALEKAGVTAALSPTDAEAFRLLRANLRYFNVDRDVRSVLITSAAPGDGKSTVAWHLAAAAAAARTRVLVVEGDLRHPGLGRALERGGGPGLSTVLAGASSFHDAVERVPVSDGVADGDSGRSVDVLFSGPIPPNPTDLIESDRMREVLQRAQMEYDLVVVDTPPTSVVSDAIPLVSQVGGVLVVGRVGKSTRDSLTNLRDQLVNLDAPVLGVVVNGLGRDASGYGYGYGYGPGKTAVSDATERQPAATPAGG